MTGLEHPSNGEKRWDGSFDSAIEIMEWVKSPTDYLNGSGEPRVNYREFGRGESGTTHLVIHLPDGAERINKGDRIIRDSSGFRVEAKS